MSQPTFWQTRGLTAQLLRPLAGLYQLGRLCHRTWQQQHLYWAGIPVISIGNLTVGGAGKTPLVLKLAEHYAKQGQQVAILSRGYGSRNTQPQLVQEHSTAAEVGDEPLMLYRQLVQQQNLPISIWVGKNRTELAKRAEQAGASLLVLDDGFQRVDIARTVNICVIHGQQGLGNGLCLPAGPLREPITALQRADFAVVMNPSATNANTYWGVPAYRLATTLNTSALNQKTRLVAFAGIAHPQAFFNALTAAQLNVAETISFPDHHAFTAADITLLEATAKRHKATLVTTQKDAVRLPHSLKAIALPQTLSGDDWENILAEIDEKLA